MSTTWRRDLEVRVERAIDFGRDEPARWSILVGRVTEGGGGSYMPIPVPVGDRDKAERIAEYLRAELGPENEEVVALETIRYEQMDRDMRARQEERDAEAKCERATRKSKLDAGEGTPATREKCPSCGELAEAGDYDEPVYECSRCGQSVRGEDGRRCASCNIFTAKVADLSCPSCEEALEGEPETIEGQEIDGVFVEAGEEA